jgi:hypothetical protein
MTRSFQPFGSGRKAAKGAPVHPRWLFGESIPCARTAAESQSDLLRLAQAAIKRAFLLARIGQAVAAPAREQLAASVQHRDSAPAVPTTGIDRTDEPGAAPAKVTGRPGDGHALFNRFPLRVAPATRPIHQNHGVPFSAYTDAPGRLSTARPRTRKVLISAQSAFAMPAATHLSSPTCSTATTTPTI